MSNSEQEERGAEQDETKDRESQRPRLRLQRWPGQEQQRREQQREHPEDSSPDHPVDDETSDQEGRNDQEGHDTGQPGQQDDGGPGLQLDPAAQRGHCSSLPGVIVVTRFDVPQDEGAAFQVRAEAALSAFGARPGFVRGRLGRSADEPTAWVLTTEWEGVGAYRRSLSAYDVKVEAAPLLGLGRDEASAFEVLYAVDDAVPVVSAPSDRAKDAGLSRVGESSGPVALP